MLMNNDGSDHLDSLEGSLEQDDAVTLSVLESLLAEDENPLDFGEVFADAPADEALPILETLEAETTLSSSSSSSGKTTAEGEEKKKSTKTKRADRKAALQLKASLKKETLETPSPPSPTKEILVAAKEGEEAPAETKEDKKQRRLIRNRMSAQLHRERKKAYVDHLESLLRDRDAEIAALKAENETLKAGLRPSTIVSLDGSDAAKSSSSDDDSDSDLRVPTRKKARLGATALLAAVSCVALLSSPPTPPPATYDDPPVSRRRALLSDAPFESHLPGLDRTAAPSAWAYDRRLDAELFTFPRAPAARSVHVLDNATYARAAPAKLRGLRGRPQQPPQDNASLAILRSKSPRDTTSRATSYVVCSSAAGVFGRGDESYDPGEARRPHGALLTLPSAAAAAEDQAASPLDTDDFIQLLVPSTDIDLRPWGHVPDDGRDLWLEIGAELRYGRLVSDINIHPV